jgi:hypothetical protein
MCQRRAIVGTGWFPAVGPMMALGCPMLHRHHHQAHREPTSPAGTPMKMSSFSFIYISLYYEKPSIFQQNLCSLPNFA